MFLFLFPQIFCQGARKAYFEPCSFISHLSFIGIYHLGILTQKNHDVENLVFDDRKTQEIHNSTKTRAKLIQHGNNRHCTKCSISVSSKSPGYRHFKVCQGIDINGKNDSSKYFAEPEKKVDKKTKECEKVCSSEKELKSMNYEEEANEVQNSFPAQKSSQVLENISPVSTEELLTKISFKGIGIFIPPGFLNFFLNYKYLKKINLNI